MNSPEEEGVGGEIMAAMLCFNIEGKGRHLISHCYVIAA